MRSYQHLTFATSLLWIFMGLTFSVHAQGTWTLKPQFGGVARKGAVGFSIGSKAYVGTGEAASGVFKDDLWQFDGTSWTQMANFPGGIRTQSVGFTINNKGYIGTGYNYSAGNFIYRNDFWEFNPTSNSWTQKADLPAQGRSEAVGFSIGGKGYIGTGYYYIQPIAEGLNDFWEYDPTTNQWTQKANFPAGKRYAAVGFAANNKGIVGTGRYINTYYSDMWEFNPNGNTWTSRPALPGGNRRRAVGFSLCDIGYVGTGEDVNGTKLSDFYQYQAATSSWAAITPFPGGTVESAAAFVFNNKGYIVTGNYTAGLSKIFYEFTPSTPCVNPCGLTQPAGADKTICSGNSVSIGSTSVGGMLYSWSPSTSLSSGSVANPTASPNNTTTYYVFITNAAGCFQTDTVVVTVKPSPTANAGAPQTICASQLVQIGQTAVAGVTYSWWPSTALSNPGISNPFATPTTTTTYTLYATGSNACTAQSSVTITVNSVPTGLAGANKSICIGQSTTIGLTSVSGLTYAWSPSTGLNATNIAMPTANPTTTTSYVLTATNSSNCQRKDTVVVTVNPLPTANAGADKNTCAGVPVQIGNTAAAGFSYVWTPTTGLSNPNIANPTATITSTTTYSLTVTNNQTNCSATDVMVVIVAPAPTANAGADKSTCAGTAVSIGSAAVTGVTYSWSPATGLSSATAANPSANPTTTTTYTVYASNGNCTVSDQVVVTVKPLPAANAGADQTICSGSSAQIGQTAVSGVTYLWSPSTGLSSATVANPSASPTSTTTYTLTATLNGCTKIDNVIITVAAAPTANAGADKTTCAGTAVSIGATAVAGVTYSWSPATGLSSATVANPSANPTTTTTYTVYASIGNCTKSDQVLVTVKPLPAANAGTDQTLCLGSSIQIGQNTVNGVSYSWSPATGLSSATIANPIASPTTTTTYTLTATLNGCTKTDNVTITVASSVTANAGADKTMCSGTPVSIGSAAVAGVTYLWSPATGLSSATVANPTANPTATTTYTLTASVGNCSSSDAVVVTVKPSPAANAGADKTICAGSSAQIGQTAVTGVTYSWSPSTGLSNANIANPVASPTATTTYTLTATLNGCSKTDVVIVNVGGSATANAGADKTMCIGSPVSIGATAVAGVTYSWFPTTGLSSAFVANPTANPTTTTTYTVYASVGNCGGSDQVIVTVNSLPTANAGADKTICAGGSVQIGTAAVSGMTYNWSPSTGLSNANTANPIASPTATTTYTLTVTNSNTGCSKTDVVIVNVSSGASVSAGADKFICTNGSTSIGGTAVTGASYSWSPATGLNNINIANPTASPSVTTTYIVYNLAATAGCGATDTVIVTVLTPPTANAGVDKTICAGASTTIGVAAVANLTYSWSPATGLSSAAVANPTASPTTTTTYTLTVTNQGGCSSTDVMIVTVNASPAANAGPDKMICIGNSVQIGATAVTGVSYSWSPATGLSSASASNPTASPTTTTTYTLTTTSASNGCSRTDQVTVTVNSLPQGTAGSDKNSCLGGNAQIGTTAVAGYSYSWSPATGLSSASVSNPTASPSVTTTYTLTITDNNTGCSKTDQVVVNITSGPGANAGADKGICQGQSVQIGTAAISGLTYLWTPSTGLNSTTGAQPFASPSVTTTYTLTVTDPNTACSSTDLVTVIVGPSASFNAGPDKAICIGGSVQIGAAPVSGYSYSWTPSTNLNNALVANPIANPTVTTVYQVTAYTTSGGCGAIDTVIVTVNSLPVANAGADKTVCSGLSAQIGSAAVSGITYSWTPTTGLSNPSISNPTASPLSATTYTVFAINSSTGCTTSDQVQVTVSTSPTANAGVDKTYCQGTPVQIGTTAVSGLTYTWSPSSTLSNAYVSNPLASPNFTTTYNLTVRNAAGCTATDQVTVTVNASLNASAGADKNICIGNTVQLGTTGATGVSYNWSPSTGLSSNTVANPISNATATTTYILTVVGNGCVDKDTVVVNVNPNVAPLVNAGADVTICQGEYANIGANGINGINYAWAPAATVVNPNIASTLAAPNATTNYILTATNGATGCASKDTVKVTVNPAPNANAGPNKTISLGGTTAIGTGAQANVSYNWSPSMTLSAANIPNPIASPTTTTTYIVTATNNNNGCIDRDTVVVYVTAPIWISSHNKTTGIDENRAQNTVYQVYPNPTENVLNVTSAEMMEGEVKLSIKNSIGQTLWLHELSLQDEMINHVIDLSNFAQGVYFLQIEQAGQIITHRIVKQ
ncbi:MAG: T9SS type A sorting domain-containing protein [Bacteroidia bacterium]